MTRILFAKLICAWCNAVLGTVAGDRDSHGICRRCKDKLLKESKKK
jgi:ribosomal protein L40E